MITEWSPNDRNEQYTENKRPDTQITTKRYQPNSKHTMTTQQL